jgi:hypothetical protein
MKTPPFKKYRSHGQPLPEPTPIDYGESKTIPDQALSVRDILHRYTTGQSLSVNNNTPVYLENVPLYDTRRKSNIDIARDRYNLEQEILSTTKEYNDTVDKLTIHRKTKQAEKAAEEAAKAATGTSVSGTTN